MDLGVLFGILSVVMAADGRREALAGFFMALLFGSTARDWLGKRE